MYVPLFRSFVSEFCLARVWVVNWVRGSSETEMRSGGFFTYFLRNSGTNDAKTPFSFAKSSTCVVPLFERRCGTERNRAEQARNTEQTAPVI